MKTLYFVAGLLIFCACSSKAEEINVSNLETACDHLDAIEKIVETVIELKDGKEKRDLPEDVKAKLQILEDKTNEIEKSARKKDISTNDFKKCSNFEEVTEKIIKAGNY